MNVPEIFAQVANQMGADVQRARAAMNHAGLKGGEFEKVFRKFLRQYLPASLDISTGQAVDSKGGVSKQLDVIIADTGLSFGYGVYPRSRRNLQPNFRRLFRRTADTRLKSGCLQYEGISIAVLHARVTVLQPDLAPVISV